MAYSAPQPAAFAWARAICNPETFEAAWLELTHLGFRRRLARSFVAANLAKPFIAGENAAEVSEALAQGRAGAGPLWQPFAQVTADEFQASVGLVNGEGWGIAVNPRPLAPGIENIVFAEGTEIAAYSSVRSLVLVMVSTDAGWVVAASGVSEGQIPAFL